MRRLGALSQLRLLLWKNLLVQLRSKVFTLFEIGLPLLLVGSSFLYLLDVFQTKEFDSRIYEEFPITGTAADYLLNSSAVDNRTMMLSYCAPGDIDTGNILSNLPSAIAYSPSDNPMVNSIMQSMLIKNPAMPFTGLFLTLMPFQSEEAMVKNLSREFSTKRPCLTNYYGGVVFETANATFVRYKIRLRDDTGLPNTWSTDSFNYPSVTGQRSQMRAGGTQVQGVTSVNKPEKNVGGPPDYHARGFLSLQMALDRGILQYFLTHNGSENTFGGLLPTDDAATALNSAADKANNDQASPFAPTVAIVQLRRFASPAHTQNVKALLITQLASNLVLSLLGTVTFIVRSIAVEKEKKLKVYMRIMGLGSWLHWAAHFIVNYVKLLIWVAFTILVFVLVLPSTSWLVVLLTLLLYALTVVYASFFMSVLIKSANAASMVSSLVWIGSYIFMVLINNGVIQYSTWALPTKLVLMLNPNCAMQLFMDLISAWELQNGGITWNDVTSTVSASDNLRMYHIWVMLAIDFAWLLILTWYIEGIYPGDDSAPQKLWFPFLPSYWGCVSPKTRGRYVSRSNSVVVDAVLEAEPEGLEPTVVIDGLTKIWGAGLFGGGTGKKAVSNLHMSMYSGQVTALLGHNGAGKSTTFAMLTGMTSASSGHAIIRGYDTNTSFAQIRRFLGLCPQHDILFGELTAQEHLYFFCELKERAFDKTEMDHLMSELRLNVDTNLHAKNMSGGQKRKLSLAISLIGGSEVVMLDEPTSGMDPSARHDAWKLLQNEKKNRTVLLTTHYMEEADLLGDRIAILAKGKLQCYGSSLFLKGHYGAGYHVTVVFDREETANQSEERAQAVLTTIQQKCPEAMLVSAIGQEATILLPAFYRNRFEEIFMVFEENQGRLGILSFGVSVTTMEEVFLKVGQIADERAERSVAAVNDGVFGSTDDAGVSFERRKSVKMERINLPVTDWEDLAPSARNGGFSLLCQHFVATILKRLIFIYRHWSLVFWQLALPILFCGIMIVSTKNAPASDTGSADAPALTLSLKSFSDSDVPDPFLLSKVDTTDITGALLYQTYNETVGSSGFVSPIPDNDTMDSFMNRSFTELGVHKTFDRYIGGIEMEEGLKLTAYFTNQNRHITALTLNLLNNALLKAALSFSGGGGADNVGVEVVNHPLPSTGEDSRNNGINSIGITFAFFLPPIIGMIVGHFCELPIEERKLGTKHLQFLSGLSPTIYWLATFLTDFIIYWIPMGVVVVLMIVFDTPFLIGADNIITTFILLILTAVDNTLFMYLWSFLFRSANKGAALGIFALILSAQIPMVVVIILEFGVLTPADAELLRTALYLFMPMYSLADGVYRLTLNKSIRDGCESPLTQDLCAIINNQTSPFDVPCCRTGSDRIYVDHALTWDFPGILRIPVILAVQSVLQLTLLLLIDYDFLRNIVQSLKNGCAMICLPSRRRVTDALSTSSVRFGDADVKTEQEFVAAMDPRQYPNCTISTKNVTKYYGDFKAVNGVNFHVNRGECFGLLGVNGAGKTTTFKMLTGEVMISSGDAFVNQVSVRRNWRKAGLRVGYCPQFDAVLQEMTGYECLKLFGRIRGIPERDLNRIANATLGAVGIQQYANIMVRQYSGGNRRRLSLAVALVGLPDVLFLDEPTAGVDPAARRTVWNVLSQIRHHGSALVLTSHSMEECEALCTRLAIMVAGQFLCLGSPQHLKSQYGQGYTLTLKVKDLSVVNHAIKGIMKKFPGSILKEVYLTQLRFEIPRNERKNKSDWSKLFGRLERLSERISAIDYALSQTTLEQIFLEFCHKADWMAADNSQSQMQELRRLTVDTGELSNSDETLANGAWAKPPTDDSRLATVD